MVPGLVRLELAGLLGLVVAVSDDALVPNHPDIVLARLVLAQIAGVLGPERAALLVACVPDDVYAVGRNLARDERKRMCRVSERRAKQGA